MKIWLIIAMVLVMIPAAYAPVWYGSGDDTGLVGKWSCEGNFVDSSGQGNHGTQVGGVTITTGAKGRGCGFDGANDEINLSSDLLLDDIKNWTVSAWVKSPSSGTQVILSHRDGNPAYNFFAIASSVIAYRHYNNTWSFEYGTINVIDNNWHLLTWVNNGSSKTIDMYVDGRIDVTKNSEIIGGTGVVNRIGVLYGGAAWFYNGTMDEFRVYNRSLSPSEVSALYNTTKTYKIQMYTTPVKGVLNDTPAPTASNETGLVGYWKMDDLVNGNTTDSSGLGNNGSVIGATFNSGRWDKGYNFDGSNDNIALGDIDTNVTTVCLWYKYMGPGTGVEQVLATKGFYNDGGYAWTLYLYPTATTLRFYVNGLANSVDFFPSHAYITGTWYHMCGGYNGTNILVYENGVLSTTTTSYVSSMNQNNYKVTIGSGVSSGSYYANGTIDEVRIYNRSLSADEIKELYLSKGLVGYWKMDADQKNSTSTFDSSGYYNHGLISGATLTNEGRFKEGYKFDGNDRIWTPLTYDLDTENYTFSAWAKISDLTHNQYTIFGGAEGGNANNYWVLIHRTDKSGVTLQYNNGSGNALFTTPSQNLVANKTTHIVMVREQGSNVKIYQDGVQISDTNMTYVGFENCNITIGQDGAGGSSFVGMLDELRIYNRALTASEVAGLYNGTKSNHIELWTTPVQGSLNDTPAPTNSNETGLVGYWKLDDLTNGNTTDSHITDSSQNNGSVIGATFTNNGRFDKGYSFDGDDWILASAIPSVDWDGNYTFSAWVYPKARGDTNAGVVFQESTANERNGMTISNVGVVSFGYYTAGTGWIGSSGTTTLNNWHHVVGVNTASSLLLYIDGIAQSGGTTLYVHNSPGLYLGRHSIDLTGNFNGTIDEVRIYNRSLSTSEIRELYLSKGLVGYWKMDADQRNTTSTFDSSGYYNHGLISGATLTNEGRFKEGYKFDGSNDYVNISFSQSINVSQNPTQYTLGAWIRFSGKEGFDGIVSPRAVAVDSFGMTRETGRNDINCFMYNSTATAFNTFTTTTFANNVWYYVVCTNNGSVVKAYTNGVYEASTAFSGGVKTQSTNGWVLGRYYSDANDHYFNGTIDEVRIYNRALSDSEVGQLYNGTKTNRIQLFSIPG